MKAPVSLPATPPRSMAREIFVGASKIVGVCSVILTIGGGFWVVAGRADEAKKARNAAQYHQVIELSRSVGNAQDNGHILTQILASAGGVVTSSVAEPNAPRGAPLHGELSSDVATQ